MAVADQEEQKTNSDLSSATGLSAAENRDREARASTGPTDDTDSGDDQVGQGYTSEDSHSSGQKKFFARNRKKIVGGGVLGGGVVGIIIGGFMSMLPLKVLHIVQNIQDYAFASAEEATDDMTDNLLRHWLVQMVIPGMVQNNCTSTRASKNCVNTSTSTTIVGVLFNSWRDGRLEQKLADRGLEIRREGKNIWIRVPNQPDIDLGNYDPDNTRNFENRAFQRMKRAEARSAIREVYQDETLAKRVMYRYSVGGLLERKYHIKRCIMICQTRDSLNSTITGKKVAFKSYMVERVVAPRNEMLALAMNCAIQGLNCADTPTTADENGDRLSPFEQDANARLEELRSQYGQEDLDELNKKSEEMRNKGMVQVGFEKILGETTGKLTAKAIPIIGWIDLGATVSEAAANAGPALKKMAYVTNSTTAVALFGMYATSADEIKTGEIDAAVLGSITESLGPDPSADQGGGGAEQSQLYSSLMDGSTIAFSGSSTVYAADEKSSGEYFCNSGKYPKEGEACPEERLGNVNGTASGAANAMTGMANSPMFASTTFISGVWNDTAGRILDAIGGVIGEGMEAVASLVPGYGAVKDKITEVAESVTKTVTQWLIPSSLSDNPSGARKFNVAYMGGVVGGSEFAQNGLGAPAVAAGTNARIYNERESRRIKEFKEKSLYARVFDTNEKYSVVSRVAVSVPTSSFAVKQNISSLIANPLHSFSSLLSFITAPPQTSAANQSRGNPFGVQEYAYDKNDPVFNEDPEKIFASYNCADPNNKKAWAEKAEVDPETQMPVNKTSNPCMLLRTSISNTGCVYNTELCETPPEGSQATDSDATGIGNGNLEKTITVKVPGEFIKMPSKYSCSGRETTIDSRIAPALAYLLTTYDMCADDGLANGHKSHGAGLGVDIRPKNNNDSKDEWKKTVEKAARDMGWTGDSADEGKSSKGCAPAYSGYGACVGGNGEIPKWVRWIGYNGDVDHGDPWHVFGGSYAHIHLGWNTPNSDGVSPSIISSPRTQVYTFSAPIPEDLSSLISDKVKEALSK